MQNLMFISNVANGSKDSVHKFDASIYYKNNKDNLKIFEIKQNWSIGSVKDNAIEFLKDKQDKTVCVVYLKNGNKFTFMLYDGKVTGIMPL
jgi:hypothetical protein